MPLRYLLDQHLRRKLWNAIRQHNARGLFPIDVMRVGDPPDLPLGSLDPTILLWIEREGRILVTRDQSTMPGHTANHLAAGHQLPGIMLVRPRCLVKEIIEYLVLAAYASEPWEWQDQIRTIP